MNCKECKYCKQTGVTSIVKKAGLSGGRAMYCCIHPKIYEMKDEFGYPINNFIGYGDGTSENSLQLKSAKRWCPLKAKGEKE